MEEHKCKGMLRKRDHVDEVDDMPLYGYAIHSIVKTDKGWIMHNNEYGDYISFCPFCGHQL